MTQRLKDAFDDLATSRLHDVDAHAMARSAWSAGTRARRRRVLVAVAAAILAISCFGSLIAFVVHTDSAQPANGGTSVDGYPQRIGKPWSVYGLTDKPGPIAGLAQYSTEKQSGWYAVGESAHLWRIVDTEGDDVWPTLSPSGRYLGFFSRDDGQYVICDLVHGSVKTFDLDAALTPRAPGFWSPDESHLLLAGGSSADASDLMLGVDGSATSVLRQGSLAGFVDADSIGWFNVGVPDAQSPLSLVVTSLDGAIEHRQPLGNYPTSGLSQWSASLSPDGSNLFVVARESPSGAAGTVFDTGTGAVLSPTVNVTSYREPCATSWQGKTPVVTTLAGVAESVAVVHSDTKQLVITDPRLGIQCLMWASDALSGDEHTSAFGFSTAWWTWHWRQLLAWILGGGLALVLLVWVGKLHDGR